MHVRSIGILAVLSVGIAVGCQGGGGESADGNFVPGEYQPPPSSYDTPGSSVDQPPADDTPPSDFDSPPDSSGSGSSASTRSACERLCRSLAASGCEQGSVDQAGCVISCTDGLTEAYDVCVDELVGVLDCVIRSPNFNCGLYEDGEVNGDAFAHCEVPALAFGRCAEQNPQRPDPDPDGGFGGEGNL